MLLNYRLISRYLGALMAVTSALILVPTPWALWFREFHVIGDLAFAAAAGGLLSGLFFLAGRRASTKITQRDALLLVTFAWVLVSAVGALPFIVSGELGVVDAYFESMSGFTTTGSSVYVALDNAPRTLVFWRSFMHWIGGLGLVLLMTAILPNLGTSIKQFVLRESTGPDPRPLRPTIRDTASILYKVYLALTVLGTLLLMLAGFNLFDAMNHCFSAIATGGFSTTYASVAAFDNHPAEVVLILLMLLGGINFTLYYDLARGFWMEALKRTEVRVFLAYYVLATIVVALNLYGAEYQMPVVTQAEQFAAEAGQGETQGGTLLVPRTEYGFAESLRKSSFQVATMMTTTGFVIDDYDQWPYLSRVLLIFLALMGGCAGSTAGGFKIIRLIILIKALHILLERAFRPYIVRSIRLRGEALAVDVEQKILGFFVLYVVWLAFSTAVLSAMGAPLITALSATVGTVSNAGPGLELVGPAMDFSAMPAVAKLFLTFNMLVGRLELVTVLALFVPGFWKRE